MKKDQVFDREQIVCIIIILLFVLLYIIMLVDAVKMTAALIKQNPLNTFAIIIVGYLLQQVRKN